MLINNPVVLNHIIASGGEVCRVKILTIGDWNMVNNDTVNVAHGLNAANILFAVAHLQEDGGSVYRHMASGMTFYPWGGFRGGLTWNATNIILYRTGKGAFDTTMFDQTSYNRGYVFVFYRD